MNKNETNPQETQETLTRSCGTCYSCCVHLGISQLKKYPGQSCKNLNGNLGPETRCSIYPNRPKACSRYSCAWLEGLGSEVHRPDKSGILITPYPLKEKDTFSVTIMITNHSLAGDWRDENSLLRQIIHDLLNLLCKQIRIISYSTKQVILFKDSKIYLGKLLPTKEYEELIFSIQNLPIGTYETKLKE